VLALRGDPPGDPEGRWVQHPEGVAYAADLVELLCNHGDFCVGVAAFPNGHPRSASLDDDTKQLVAKFSAGAEYAVTNMFFVADDYLRLRDRVSAAGCDAPIIAGLMPVTNIGMIRRSEKLTGAPFPDRLGARFAAVAHDPKAVRSMGIYETSKLAEKLLEEGVPGIHFYTLNRSKATREVWANLALGVRV
jgi:methylenetetrahydrofolate reductase (NADPH)